MKSKRIISMLLAAMLCAGIAGCGANPSSGSSGSNSTSAATTASGNPSGSTASGSGDAAQTPLNVSDNFNPEGLPICKEPETFKVVVEQQSTKVAAKDKECYIKTAEETNVLFNWVEIPAANMKEKVNIMFASSDLPDMFASDIDVGTHYEQLAVLDDYIQAYAPNVLKLFEDRPEYKQILTAPDGKIHFLPGGDEAYNNQIDRQHWINKGWLDKLGMEIPTTTDEFYTVLKAFKEKDPNGNGQADEIPFTFHGIWDWATGLGNMFGSFGTLEGGGHIYVKDGKVVFSATETGYYEALKYFNKLYTEGLIDPESFTQSLDQYNTRGKGKDIFGSVIGYRANSVLGPEHEFDFAGVPPLKGPNGDQMTMANYINQLTGVQITVACQKPEVLVRWYDYINSSNEMALLWGRGKENVNWKRVQEDGQGRIVVNLKTDPELAQDRSDMSFGGQTPSLWTLHRDDALTVPDPDNPAPDVKHDLIEQSMPFAFYGTPTGLDTVENTQRKALLITDIETYLEKFIADSIMNGIDDAKWEKHLKTLDELKVQEYTSLCQEYLDKV